MTQTLHIVRKDLARLRWWLVCWAMLTALQTTASIVGPPAALRGIAEMILVGQVNLILSVVMPLMTALLIARLVHEEPLAGLDWYWLTRPYEWRSLVGAKLLLACVSFVGLPLVGQLTAMTAVSAGPADLLLATPQAVASQLVWVLGLMVFAVLTRSLARYSLAIAGTFTMLAVLIAGTVTVAIWHGETIAIPNLVAPVADSSGAIVMQVLMLVAVGATVVYAYRTRRFASTLLVATVSPVAAFILPMFWPWSFAAIWPSDLQRGLPSSVTATLDLTSPSRIDDTFQLEQGRGKRLIAVPARIQLPPEFSVRNTLAHSQLRFDGQTLESSQRGGVRSEEGRTEVHPLHRTFPGDRILPFTRLAPMVPVAALLSVTDSDLDRYGDRPGRLTTTVFYNLSRSRIVARLPLVAGAAYDADRIHISILRVERQFGGCAVFVRRWRVSSPLSAAQWRAYEWVIRNRGRKQVVTGDQRLQEGAGVLFPVLPLGLSVGDGRDGFEVSHVRIDYPATGQGATDIPRLDREWMADAELVAIETVDAGWIARTMTVDNFQIRPAPAVTQSGR